MRYQQRTLAGKAYLETGYLLFRGPERVKILFQDLTTVSADAGTLHLEWPDGPADLILGKAAAKWADKILHPPARADKLGLKAGVTARLLGDFPADFEAEIKALNIRPALKPDLLFLSVTRTAELSTVAKLARSLPAAGALWIIYPKGVAAIREIDVIESGRAAELKDVKVASFSATHTALKFVIPVEKRRLFG
jgi:hypothetical protein